MLNLKNILNVIKPLIGLILVFVLAYFFFDIFVHFLIAAVLSLMGRPLVNLYKKIHIGKWQLPNWLAAVMTLLSIILIVASFFLLLFPSVSREASMVSQIDTKSIADFFQGPIDKVHDWLINYGIISPNEDLTKLITTELNKLLNFTKIGTAFDGIINAASSVMIGIFSVFFMLFFFLRDQNILRNIVMSVTPDKYVEKMGTVLSDTRRLLTRYFLGLLLEVVCMMTLITILLLIFGIKNALLIGFIGGMMNLIPYLGPIIGCTIGVVLGVISTLSIQEYANLLPHILLIIVSFVGANTVDNMLLQPIIYSKSVKAHPLEIFIVILIAGKIGGAFGMIIAIPTYTVLRIIARQFWGHLKFVDALVRNMEVPDRKKT